MTNTAFQNSFTFNLNVDIVKSTGATITKADELDYDNMFIEGIASDTSPDVEGEIMNPENFDLSYLLGGAGKINADHDKNAIIGQIIDAKIIKGNKLWIKGRLLSSSELAKKIYKNAWEMQSDPASTIRASWSIEGKAIERDDKNPNKVTKALITMVALTNTPINFKNTYAEVVKKSLNADCRIFENSLNDFEKSIIGNSSIDDDFKMDLIKYQLTPSDYVQKFISLSNSKPNLTISQFHKALDFKKSLPEMDLYKCLVLSEKTNINPLDLTKDFNTTDSIDNELKKGFICYNYLKTHDNLPDEILKAIYDKLGL